MIKIITERNLMLPLEYKDIITEVKIDDFEEWISEQTIVGCDTESELGLSQFNTVLSLQIGDEIDQYMFDFTTLLGYQKNIIADVMANPDIKKIWHNAKYDINVLRRSGIHKQKNYYDTQLAELIYDSGLTRVKGWRSLEGILSRRYGVTTEKNRRTGFTFENIMQYDSIIYATKDVKYLKAIREAQMGLLQQEYSAKDDDQDLYTVLGLENRSVFAFAEMEYEGIGINMDKHAILKKKVDDRVLQIIEELNQIVLTDSVLSKSYKAVPDLFGESFYFPWGSSVKKLILLKKLFPNITSTDKHTLAAHEGKHIIFAKLIEFSSWNSIKTKFVDSLPSHINKETGKIHTNIWQILSTGRISMSDPNLQQISSKHELAKDLRAVFVADPGQIFGIADYSGCELRIIADHSKDPLWLDTLNSGKDLHSELCAATFNIAVEIVRQVSPYGGLSWRDVQKTLDFGIAYGMGVKKLASTLKITKKEAATIIDTFFETCPNVNEFLENIARGGISNRYVRTGPPYFRIRKFDGWNPRWSPFKIKVFKESIARKSKNFPFQGGNANIIKLALVYIYERRDEAGLSDLKILLQIHDEIITMMLKENGEKGLAFMQEQMVAAGRVCIKSVPMVCDAKLSEEWVK